jgi:proteasome lid subunit RPN8/RPN11
MSELAWVGEGLLVLTQAQLDEVVAACLRAAPQEGCGLVAGDPETGIVRRVYPTRNAARSSRIYTVDPRDHLHVERDAEASGSSVIGVFHSHTHTDPYPSPTDIDQAPDPAWHYVIASLRLEAVSLRSYRIVDGVATEEPVVVTE